MSPNYRPNSPNSVVGFVDDEPERPLATHLGWQNGGENGIFVNFDLDETMRRLFVQLQHARASRITMFQGEEREEAIITCAATIQDLVENSRNYSAEDWIELWMPDISRSTPGLRMHWMDWFLMHGHMVDRDEGHVNIELPELEIEYSDEETETTCSVTLGSEDTWDPLPVDQELENLDLDFLADFINE